MRLIALSVVLAILGQQAAALSCRRPNLADAFNWYQDQSDVYRIVVGTVRLTSTPAKYVEGKPRTARAEVTGRFLGRNGLAGTQTLPITVQTHCVAHWCGGFPNDRDKGEVLMFLRKSDSGDVLDMYACPNNAFSPVTQKRLSVLQRCLRKGTCSKADVRRMDRE